MKKTKKAFGAIALSAALALGTAVPAFAADPTLTDEDASTITWTDGVGDGTDSDSETDMDFHYKNEGAADEDKTAGTSTSKVYLESRIPQITVQVPLYVKISANVTGGAITAPTPGAKNVIEKTGGSTTVDGTATLKAALGDLSSGDSFKAGISGYRIQNHSVVPVTVTGVKTDLKNTDWELNVADTSTYDAKASGKIGALNLTVKPSDAVEKAAGNSASASFGSDTVKVYQGINEGDTYKYTSPATSAEVTIDGTNTDTATTWLVKECTTADTVDSSGAVTAKGEPGIMGLSITGTSSKLNLLEGSAFNALLDGDKYLDNVFDIVFTVSA